MTVAAILAEKGRNVLTIAADRSLGDAVEMLARHKVGALVVVEDSDRIVGIVSERDIVRTIASSHASALGQPVGSAMTKNVVTCNDRDTIDTVMSRMTKGRFRHLPVAEDDRLTGIVSIGDVVKARIEQVEREAEEMRAYIATA